MIVSKKQPNVNYPLRKINRLQLFYDYEELQLGHDYCQITA